MLLLAHSRHLRQLPIAAIERDRMSKTLKVAALAAVAGLVLAACGGSGSAKTLVISSDLPLQGSSKDSNDSTNKAMQLYLETIDEDANTEADYIVVEIARHLLGEDWLPDYVARANDGGIERVLV